MRMTLLYSRLVVGWMVAPRESAKLAERLVVESLDAQGIGRDRVTLHADRGPSQTAKSLALLLADLGVRKSHSRPYTSNDNPFSEAQFKTLKYQPSYPERFGSLPDARGFCAPFFLWYNTEHRHSSLAYLTPADVHYGRAEPILRQRSEVLRAAFEANPQRYKGRLPSPGTLPKAVWINPPEMSQEVLSLPGIPDPEPVAGTGTVPGINGSHRALVVARPPSSGLDDLCQGKLVP